MLRYLEEYRYECLPWGASIMSDKRFVDVAVEVIRDHVGETRVDIDGTDDPGVSGDHTLQASEEMLFVGWGERGDVTVEDRAERVAVDDI